MFKILKSDGSARLGTFSTPHGEIQTPAFMNVATAGAIRGGVSTGDLALLGCPVCLCNTYHLHLRPGEGVVASLGGLHRFIGWDGPILTDSGGFQVFSLAKRRGIREEGVTFTSFLDGKKIFLSPETSMRIQYALGSDIAMAFDECVSLPCDEQYAEKSAARTTRWLERCVREHEILKKEGASSTPDQLLFGIGQGASFPALRRAHMTSISALPTDGLAIGGLSVGEEAAVMYEMIEESVSVMPREKVRYLMGVGTPENILEAVRRGIDLFDCVLPGRNAYRGNVFTFAGKLRLLSEKYKADPRPIDENCACPVCRRYSRAYIRHLIKSEERLGMRLCVLHNLYFYNHFLEAIRGAIAAGLFDAYYNKEIELVGKERTE